MKAQNDRFIVRAGGREQACSHQSLTSLSFFCSRPGGEDSFGHGEGGVEVCFWQKNAKGSALSKMSSGEDFPPFWERQKKTLSSLWTFFEHQISVHGTVGDYVMKHLCSDIFRITLREGCTFPTTFQYKKTVNPSNPYYLSKVFRIFSVPHQSHLILVPTDNML